MQIGTTFNESRRLVDTATGRGRLQLTTRGGPHIGPPYHSRGAFTADGRFIVLAARRDGGSGLLRADVHSGDLTVLAWAAGDHDWSRFALHEQTGWIVASAPGIASAPGVAPAPGIAPGIAPGTRPGSRLLMIHIHSFEQRCVLDGLDESLSLGCPCWSLDGGTAIVTHQRRAHGDKQQPNPATYLAIDVASGACTTLWEDPVGGSNHTQVCPADDDLLLIDRDLPPGFAWYGDHRRTSRAWLLHRRTCELTELRPRDEWRFQMHTNFNRDGTRIYYHGRACPEPGMEGGVIERTPQYVGVCDLAGKVIWQHTFPEFFYGHVSAHTTAEAVIVDGSVSSDLLCALHYEAAGPDGVPRIELLGRHGSTWDRGLGQCSHPHPVMSPDGRRLVHNASTGGRADVFVLELA